MIIWKEGNYYKLDNYGYLLDLLNLSAVHYWLSSNVALDTDEMTWILSTLQDNGYVQLHVDAA